MKGETYSTELKQRRKPGQGQLAQWEHELVCHRYEKPLILQMYVIVLRFQTVPLCESRTQMQTYSRIYAPNDLLQLRDSEYGTAQCRAIFRRDCTFFAFTCLMPAYFATARTSCLIQLCDLGLLKRSPWLFTIAFLTHHQTSS